MRKYAILGSLVILGMALAGRAVSLAQRSHTLAIQGPQLMPEALVKSEAVVAGPQVADNVRIDQQNPTLPNIPIVDEPIVLGELPPTAPQPVMATLPPPVVSENPGLPEVAPQPANEPATPELLASNPTAEALPANLVSSPDDPSKPAPMVVVEPRQDPMGAVESFLDRNRKEAESSIEALNKEAESLRGRLEKVEAALARWQEVARALQASSTTTSPEQTAPTQLESIPATVAESPRPNTSSPASRPKIWSKPVDETKPTEPQKVESAPIKGEPVPAGTTIPLPPPGTILVPSPVELPAPPGPANVEEPKGQPPVPAPASSPTPVPDLLPLLPEPKPAAQLPTVLPPAEPGPK